MRFLKEQIDRWSIRAAARSLPQVSADPGQASEMRSLLERPDLFVPPEKVPSVRLNQDLSFTFESSVSTPFPRNNIAHGRIFPAHGDWKRKPSVVILHGWNAEMHYTRVLPLVARSLGRGGLNGVLMELPYHLHRRPPQGEAITNFISENIPRMLEAVTQAIADLNAMMLWLKNEGSPGVGLWGFSLGGWLVGLHLCASATQDAAVLTTPVSNLERAVQELEFCHPIRAALEAAPCDLRPLNLSSRGLRIAPERVLLVQAKYDVFVPGESYDELARAWKLPGRKVLPQSHISILFSRAAARQSIAWLVECLGASRDL